MTVHYFEATVGECVYHVEAIPVGSRWRAKLRRGPGMPTAMMPFYGNTPEEASNLLLRWISLAHGPPALPTR